VVAASEGFHRDDLEPVAVGAMPELVEFITLETTNEEKLFRVSRKA
jgi:hypothetical protein